MVAQFSVLKTNVALLKINMKIFEMQYNTFKKAYINELSENITALNITLILLTSYIILTL